MYKFLENYFGVIKKFLPTKAEGSAIGLDVGVSRCKLVELTKEDNGYVLQNWAVETVKGGNVSAAIETLMTRIDPKPEKVYTSVYGKGTLIRYIDMPKMSIDDLKNSFAIEADKYFPFAQDQIYTDCFIVEPQTKSKQMHIMAAACKKDMVDNRIKLLTQIGLKTEYVGINSVALANAFSVLYASKEEAKATAIVDIGESVSSLVILVNGMPLFTRDIYAGGRDITKRISNALGVPFEEAEKLKIESKDEKIKDANESAFSNMIQELKLSFDYFVTEKGNEISQLILSGGTSLTEGIVDLFEKSLDVKVVDWNPFQEIKFSSNVNEQELEKEAKALGVALGLALYNYDRD